MPGHQDETTVSPSLSESLSVASTSSEPSIPVPEAYFLQAESSQDSSLNPLPIRGLKTAIDDYLLILAKKSVHNEKQLHHWLCQLAANKHTYPEIQRQLHQLIGRVWKADMEAWRREHFKLSSCSMHTPGASRTRTPVLTDDGRGLKIPMYHAFLRIHNDPQDLDAALLIKYICGDSRIRREDLPFDFSRLVISLLNRPIPPAMSLEKKLDFLRPLIGVVSIATKYQYHDGETMGALGAGDYCSSGVEPLYKLVHGIISPSRLSQKSSIFVSPNYDGLGKRGRQNDNIDYRHQILLYSLAFFLCAHMQAEGAITAAATKVQIALIKAYGESSLPENISVNVTLEEKEALVARFFKTPLQQLFRLSSHIALNVVQPELRPESRPTASSYSH